jgi:N-acetylglucosaminyldiphosphoundecaprenol N-acetyl-beta-D-mannosaminyltransferase
MSAGLEQEAAGSGPSSEAPGPCHIWGVPFHSLTFDQAVERVDEMVRARQPSYFITANLHYVMLNSRLAELGEVNRRAAFVLADGITLVWASRWKGMPLPERVTGSDLIYGLCELAAHRGYRVFFLGGSEGIAAEAARQLGRLYPLLRVVGIESPPFRPLSDEEDRALLDRIRAAAPDLLILAFSMPRGEQWLAAHVAELAVPACANFGAAIDFAAGRVCRAPRWMQRRGLETPYRILQEPRRLTSRYTKNAIFLIRMILHDIGGMLSGCAGNLLRVTPLRAKRRAHGVSGPVNFRG